MKAHLLGLIIFALLSSIISPQNRQQEENCKCPEQYTHSLQRTYLVTVDEIRMRDSAKFTLGPLPKENIDSLLEKVNYPEYTLMAEIEGKNVYTLRIDSTGKVNQVILVKGIGAGLDESAMEALKKINFTPAIVLDKPVSSEVYISINFKVKRSYDKPDYMLDEIKYKSHSFIKHDIVIIFTKEGKAYLEEDTGDELQISSGKINLKTYTKLSDFIMSLCFMDYAAKYYGQISDLTKTTISVNLNNKIKSVTAPSDAESPNGFWALQNVILNIKSKINWEPIKKESHIKSLPPRDKNIK